MQTPSAPKAPDPAKTANAQTSSNIATATAQTGLNSTNQVTPYGNLTYNVTGQNPVTYTDANGKPQTYQVPQYTATTTLSPEQQGLLDQQNQFSKGVNNLGIQQVGKLTGLLDTPFDPSTVNNQFFDLYDKTQGKVWDQRASSLDSTLANKGIKQGSDAYSRAMADFDRSREDSYNSALMQGQGQAFQEALATRNQPINETTALMAGGQVSQPNFINTPNTGIEGTDVAGITEANYRDKLSVWQQQQQAQQQMLGSAFSGLGMLGGWALSDPKTKKDKKKVGKVMTKDGPLGVYSFKYKDDPKGLQRLGMMADEVKKKVPHAVRGKDGERQVNYDRVAERT